MSFFTIRKKKTVVLTPVEVQKSKQQAKKASDTASANTQQLRKLLLNDHITLKIHVATGGKHG